MWCYQKPGFKALLLTELQRQQQCSRFCDTVMKTEDISVPVHSCILSAISPHISSALSSTPSPMSGQSRLLEFQALGACTLLSVVRLMYSGEMVGEGEKEKQEAISAAAKLGIHGLVEVAAKSGENSEWVEVGVQTEPLMEKEGGEGRWVRQVRDGTTILWKERLSGGVKDSWTQTEQLQAKTAAPESSFETIDLTCFQNLRQADSGVVPPQIPTIPMSLLYPTNENQIPQPSCMPVEYLQETTAAGPSHVVMDLQPSFSSLFSQEAASITSPAVPQVAAGNDWVDSSYEQFQGNISGYINYFLNPENEVKRRQRGRPRGSGRRSRASGARRATTGERKPRRPSAAAGRRGRGGFMETVDVQDVGLSAVQTLFLQRWSTKSSRTGQGGGAVGRKLYMKTRDKLAKTRKRAKGNMSKDPSGHEREAEEGECSNTQVLDEDLLSRVKVKPAAAVSFLSPPGRLGSLGAAPASTPSLQPSPSPGLWSSTGSYVSPASSHIHNTPVPLPPPPPPPPPQDEAVEQINRLLEEVMMGLNIFPNGGIQPVLPAGSGGGAVHPSPSRREGRPHGHAAAAEGGRWGAATRRGPDPQQQGETDFRDMLDNFLYTFEEEDHACSTGGAVEAFAQRETHAPAGSSRAGSHRAPERKTPARSQTPKAPAHRATQPKRTHNRKEKVSSSPQKKRGRKSRKLTPQHLNDFVRTSRLSIRNLPLGELRQLQMMPVVKLERRVLMPDRVVLQGSHFQSLSHKSSSTETKYLAGKRKSDESKCQPGQAAMKMYPIRSKIKKVESSFVLEQPLQHHRRFTVDRKRRPRNGNLLDLSESVQPAEHIHRGEQLQEVTDAPEEDTRAQPEEDAYEPTRKVSRTEEETGEDGAVSGRAGLQQTPPAASPSPPRPQHQSCEAADREAEEEVIDVDSLSLSSPGGLQGDKPERRDPNLKDTRDSSDTVELESCSCDELIVVDGDGEEEQEEEPEDVDVLGDPSLVAPHQVSITCPEPFKYEIHDEEEEIDIVGEAFFVTIT